MQCKGWKVAGRDGKGRGYGEDGNRRRAYVCCPQRGTICLNIFCLNMICGTLTAHMYAVSGTCSALTHALPNLKYWPDIPSKMISLWSPFIFYCCGFTFDFTKITCLLRHFQAICFMILRNHHDVCYKLQGDCRQSYAKVTRRSWRMCDCMLKTISQLVIGSCAPHRSRD